MAPQRREFAKLLRKQQTKAEDILWERLRGSRSHDAIPGLRPGDRRQVPFDRFVVDFYRDAAKLVVELDGKQHESTPSGRKSWRRAASASFVSRMRRSRATSNPCSRGSARRSGLPSTEARSPHPRPFSHGRGGASRRLRLAEAIATEDALARLLALNLERARTAPPLPNGKETGGEGAGR
jgi:hypothetical protein